MLLMTSAFAQEPPAKADVDKKTEPGALGMSILGNYEAPTALVIVPWKESEPGKGPAITTKTDDSRKPIDKEVLMRMLRYQEIAKTNEAPRRKP
jgi:hypothetical protein